MAQRFPITINDDGTVRWHGISTGKTKVLAMSDDPKLITLHVAGHNFWSGREQHYASAEITVHKYEDGPNPREIFLTELFGVMRWPARGSEWRPKQ